MPHAFITPEHAATVAAKLVAEDTPLVSLFSHNYQDEFLGQGKAGAPIAILNPVVLQARQREIDDTTNPLVADQIVETYTTINLDREMDYHMAELNEKHLNLDLTDFTAQVLVRQARAVSQSLEAKAHRHLLATPETGVAYDEADPVKAFLAIRKLLRTNGVEASSTHVLVGAGVYNDLLASEKLQNVGQSGDNAALRNANVGKLFGLNIVESTRVDDYRILAFGSENVTFVTRAPAVPKGAAFGAITSDSGIAIRYLRDYDSRYTQDRSIVATWSGVATLPTWKATYDARGVHTGYEQLANGGVINVDGTPA